MKIESLTPEEFERLLKAEDNLLLSEIYDRCFPRVIATMVNYTGSMSKVSLQDVEEDYDDCFMDIIDGVRLGVKSFNHVNKICSFLSLCVLNKHRNRGRSRKAKDDGNTISLDEQYNVSDKDTFDETSSNIDSLFNQLFDKKGLSYEDNQFEEDNPDLIKIVMEQLDNIGEPCTTILEYRYIFRLSLKELAKSVGISHNAMLQRRITCLNSLKRLVKGVLKK